MVNTLALKSKLVENGYSVGAIADKLGISRQSLGSKMNNKAEFRVTEVENLCKLLNISITDIGKYFFN